MHHKGRSLKRECNWVVGAVDPSTRRVALQTVDSRDRITLNTFVQNSITEGSLIHTDGWKGHTGYEKIGYKHDSVNHRTNFVQILDDGKKVHTQNIEATWRSIKQNLRHLNAHRRKYTQEYIQTWAYHRNIAPDFATSLFLLSKF